jgi:fatty-acyl-CoA synthase
MLQEGLSHWLPDPEAAPALRALTVADLLDEAVERSPDVEALVYSAYDEPELTLRMTYGELREAVIEVAAALIGSGLQPGDRAIVWSTNTPHHPLLQFACAYANVIMCPVNPLYRRDEIAFVVDKVRPQAIFVLPRDRNTPLWDIMVETCGDVGLRVALGTAPDEHGISWDRWLREAGSSASREEVVARRRGVSPLDLSQIQFTSGTTGFPKGVELTNWTLANQGIQTAGCAEMRTGDRVVNPMPLFHCGGCVLAALGTLSVSGTHMPIVTFDPKAIAKTVDDEKATVLLGVPTMLMAVEEEATRSGRSLDSLRTVISGGSVVPPSLGNGWQQRLGVNFVITYGQTEHGPLAAVTTPRDSPERQITTVGHPIPHTELEVVEPGTDKRVPIGVEGELRFRGYVMRGYHGDPEATATAVSPDGWLRSGDLGRIDEDGYVQITGRAKDMIIRGGENISPASVENGVRGLDQVADVCVIGVPDDAMGEEICAFVRLHDGAELDALEMRRLLLDRIARFNIPRYLSVLDEFPLTPSGKIQRFRLREMYATGIGEGSVQDSRGVLRDGSAVGPPPGAATA